VTFIIIGANWLEESTRTYFDIQCLHDPHAS